MFNNYLFVICGRPEFYIDKIKYNVIFHKKNQCKIMFYNGLQWHVVVKHVFLVSKKTNFKIYYTYSPIKYVITCLIFKQTLLLYKYFSL